MGRKRKTEVDTPSALAQILPELEERSYFDLSRETKRFLNSSKAHPVEAWSFVPHPDIIAALTRQRSQFKRYIFTIDTQRNTIYSPVRDFLLTQDMNISSYDSGGWADFICDAHFDSGQLEAFQHSLTSVLEEVGAATICPPDRGVDALFSIFEITKSHIVCGQPLNSLPRPKAKAIERLLEDRLRFEMVYRNYRSQEVLSLFKRSSHVRAYLDALKHEGIIICYRAVTDISRFTNKDYVPMALPALAAGSFLAGFLAIAENTPSILAPVIDFLEVKPIHVSDDADKEVTHMFINHYALPGERHDWKTQIYEAIRAPVNIYNYPLEGAIIESPIYLSDFPEQIAKARYYAGADGLFVGWAHHPLLQARSVEIRLPFSGLARHGVTLGTPGCGKTNSDLVLATEIASFLESVIILDGSASVSSKLSAVPEAFRSRLVRVQVANTDRLKGDVLRIMHKPGCYLVESDAASFESVVAAFLDEITALPDNTSDNSPRKLKGFLLIEEALDGFGGSQRKLGKQFDKLGKVLDKAWRKGWSLWLSTQRPESFPPKILAQLENRIIYKLANTGARQLVVNAFDAEDLSPRDAVALDRQLASLPDHTPICRGVEINEDGERRLPWLAVLMRLLEPPTTSLS
jgi:hypothetical protein